MKQFKRWTVGIASRFDSVISQVENHEAIIASSIREAQGHAARARVKLARVERDGAGMRRRIKELEQARNTWTERALKSNDTNREQAIECLRRSKQAEAECACLQSECSSHEQTAQQLRRDIRTIDERIAELKRKKNAFAAREYRAKALACANPDREALLDGLEDIFERWEIRVTEHEIHGEVTSDSFEQQFASEEETASLEAELDELLAKQANS